MLSSLAISFKELLGKILLFLNGIHLRKMNLGHALNWQIRKFSILAVLRDSKFFNSYLFVFYVKLIGLICFLKKLLRIFLIKCSSTLLCRSDYFTILHGDHQGLPDTLGFLKSLAEMESSGRPQNNNKLQTRDHLAASAMFNWEVCLIHCKYILA